MLGFTLITHEGATCTSQLVPLGQSDHVFAIVEVKIDKNLRKIFL